MAAEPVTPSVRYRYVLFYLLPLGRVAEAIEQSRLGLETDPLSTLLHNGMGMSLCDAKQYREAAEYVRRALEIDANFYFFWLTMGFAQLGAGSAAEAITAFKRAMDLAPWYHPGGWYMAAAYYQAGDRERSQEWVRKLEDSRGHSFGAARYYATTGEVDAMFQALEGAYQHRDTTLPRILNDQFIDRYRDDPRYHALLQRMNLA